MVVVIRSSCRMAPEFREETGLLPRMAMYVICWTVLAQGLSS